MNDSKDMEAMSATKIRQGIADLMKDATVSQLRLVYIAVREILRK